MDLILFKHVDLEFDDLFEWAVHPGTRGHRFKLYKKSSSIRIRQSFFSERVVNVWNRLPAQIDFSYRLCLSFCFIPMSLLILLSDYKAMRSQ